MTEPSPLVVDEDLARRTTQWLVGKLEAVALVVQASGLILTATIVNIQRVCGAFPVVAQREPAGGLLSGG